MDFQRCITINRPVEEVAAFQGNFRSEMLWQPSILSEDQTTPGPLDVGTAAREVRRILGKRITTAVTLIEYQAGRKMSKMVRTGPLCAEIAYLWEPVDGGTRFTVRYHSQSSGPWSWAAPLFERQYEQALANDLCRLKNILEGNPSGSPCPECEDA